MQKGKLYSITLINSKTEYFGIVQASGKEWVLLYNLFADFRMDGYLLLKRDSIETIKRNNYVRFKEEVLHAKGVNFCLPPLRLPLNDTIQLLKWFKENEMTITIYFDKEQACNIGEIRGILPKSFYLKAIDPEGYWLVRELLFRMKTVRVIEFDTDYVKSLLAYNLMKCKEESGNVSL